MAFDDPHTRTGSDTAARRHKKKCNGLFSHQLGLQTLISNLAINLVALSERMRYPVNLIRNPLIEFFPEPFLATTRNKNSFFKYDITQRSFI